jgi:predicted P-loop ATPase
MRVIANNQHNIRHALELLEIKLSYDTFHDRILVSGLPGHTLLDDPTVDAIWLTIDERYKFRANAEFFRVVVNNAARRNSFHPVRDYLDGLKWDRTKRLDRWLITYAGAEDTEYVGAVGAITLIAAVRRIRKPGCKFDEMLILESVQGTLKSEMLKALAVDADWFSDDVPLNADGKKVIEQLMGKWIVEAAELSGMRKADVEHLKAMLSRGSDRARLAYGRNPTEQPRQSIIVGTTNSPKYLKDLTGNRRFWPVKVAKIDLAALERDRDQLWAEAVSREQAGASIRLASTLWDAAAEQQTARTVQDPWHELLADVLGDLKGKLAAADVWRIVGVDPGHRSQEHNARLGQAMKDLEFEHKPLNIDGKKQQAYARGTEVEQMRRIIVVVDDNGAFAALSKDEAKKKRETAQRREPM